MKDWVGDGLFIDRDEMIEIDNWKKEENEMEKVLERLIGLGEEFGIMGRINGGVRDWGKMVGVNVNEDKEEFIRRCIVGCGENFNYMEEGIEGLKSEVMWEWVRSGYDKEGLKRFNLVKVREEIYDDVVWYLRLYDVNNIKLEDVVKDVRFWSGLNDCYGGDVVSKKCSLCRMMLKESGVEVWGMDRSEIIVDYNMMCVFKYLGLVGYEGGFKDDKEVINEVRFKCYEVMVGLLEVCDKGDDWLDGLLFWVGRKLREKEMVNVGLYCGCIDY